MQHCSGYCLLSTGTLLTVTALLSPTAQATPTSFSDWCTQQNQLPVAQRRTVQVMLQQAGTENCSQAQEVLRSMPYLDLGNQALQDLTPLASLPHLTGLNLSFNQIQDLRPLSELSRLSFLLLASNQIRDVSPLSNLQNLTYLVLDNNQIETVSSLTGYPNLKALSLLDNPLAEKTCPILPATVCLFSNDAEDFFAQAETQYQQGDYQRALETFQAALETYVQTHDSLHQGDALNRLGDTATQLGQYGQALTYYEQALKIRQDLEDLPGIGASLSSLAAVHERLGQYTPAETFLNQAIDNIKAQYQDGIPLEGGVYELPKDEALLYQRQALVQTQQGKYDQAIESLDLALSRYQQLPEDYPGKRHGERTTLDTLGVTYLLKGQPQNAQTHLSAAVAIARTIADRAGEGNSLSHLGSAYRAQGNYQESIRHYQQAIELLTAVGDRPGTGAALTELGKTYLEQDQPQAAIIPLLQAVDLWESLHPGLTDENKVSLFETQALTYRLLQTALVADDQIETALEISERGRARAFAELLANRLGAETSTDLSLSPLTIDEIRQVAQAQDATLVEYSITEDQLLIWVISPNGVINLRTIPLNTLEELPLPTKQGFFSTRHVNAETPRSAFATTLVQSTQAALVVNESPFDERGDWSAVGAPRQVQSNRQLHKNYQLLIEPIADLLPQDPEARVVFIPQDSLFLIPFPALQDATGRYLIEQHTPLTAPSIQSLALISHSQTSVASEDVLVIGNPTMPAIAPDLNLPPQPLAPLPGAEKEAVAIASLFNTQPLLGPSATKAAVLQHMPTARIIHLATHGLLNELNYLGLATPGAIALAPADSAETLDGFLTTPEILNLKLNAELVVLSACNTGRGKITGDGVVGLSRSLLGAGVPSVVVSLWAVPDNPTSDLMVAFYQSLNQGQDKAHALRQAMLSNLSRYPDPRDWAAFTLIGAAD